MGFLGRMLGQRITKALNEAARTPEGQMAIQRGGRSTAVAKAAREIAGRSR